MSDARIGKFWITKQVANDFPQIIKTILKDVVVIKVEFIHDASVYEYTGISEHFEKVVDGEPYKKYTVSVDKNHQIKWRLLGDSNKFDWRI